MNGWMEKARVTQREILKNMKWLSLKSYNQKMFIFNGMKKISLTPEIVLHTKKYLNNILFSSFLRIYLIEYDLADKKDG